MNIAIIGATGFVGSALLEEAVRRGLAVTAISRHTGAAAGRPNVTLRVANACDDAAIVPVLRGHDAVINSTRFVETDAERLLRVVKAAGVPRLLVVGGAGSLEVAPGQALVDTPEFPAEYKREALAARVFLDEIRRERELDWTFLSPSALLVPGERTGRFRLGANRLLVDPKGESRISVQDFAVAMLDELERPAHSRQRFTVGY